MASLTPTEDARSERLGVGTAELCCSWRFESQPSLWVVCERAEDEERLRLFLKHSDYRVDHLIEQWLEDSA